MSQLPTKQHVPRLPGQKKYAMANIIGALTSAASNMAPKAAPTTVTPTMALIMAPRTPTATWTILPEFRPNWS